MRALLERPSLSGMATISVAVVVDEEDKSNWKYCHPENWLPLCIKHSLGKLSNCHIFYFSAVKPNHTCAWQVWLR
jgi:hypothetical protein